MNTKPTVLTHSSLLHWKNYYQIARMALPVIFANMLFPLQGVVDVAIAGKIGDANAIGAVGISTSLMSFLCVPFNFLQYTTSGLSAQATGAQQSSPQLLTILVRSLLIALIIASIIILLRQTIFSIAHWYYAIDDKLFPLFSIYMPVRIGGIFADLMLYCFLGWFAGQGRTQLIFYQQITLTLCNITFSLFFVFGLHMGLSGIALGTTFALYFTLFTSILLVRDNWHFLPILLAKNALLQWQKIRTLLCLNRNLFIRSILLIFGFSWLQRLSNLLGMDILAANTVLLLLLTISSYALDGVAIAAESLAGRLIGAKNIDQLRTVIYTTLISGMLLALLLSLLYAVGIRAYIKIMADDPTIQTLALQYRYWAVMLPVISVWSYLLDGYYFAATRADILCRTMSIVIPTMVIISLVLTYYLGNSGIWLSVYWLIIMRAVLLIPNLLNRLIQT